MVFLDEQSCWSFRLKKRRRRNNDDEERDNNNITQFPRLSPSWKFCEKKSNLCSTTNIKMTSSRWMIIIYLIVLINSVLLVYADTSGYNNVNGISGRLNSNDNDYYSFPLRHRRLGQEREREHDEQQQQRHKHATSYAQRHPSSVDSGYYSYYSADDDETKKSGLIKQFGSGGKYKKAYTNLSDVGLCLLTALAWTVLMIRSFINSRKAFIDEQFIEQKDSMLVVRGHVLQVSRKNEGDEIFDDGIPKYTAVIDYVIEKEQTHESIQIRKHFDTQQALEQGFANVELLVMPAEPTHSVLKDDFEQQLQQEQRVQEFEQSLKESKKDKKNNNANTNTTNNNNNNNNINSINNEYDDDDPIGYILEGRYCNKKCKRLSTALAGTLVLVSLAGTVHVVSLMQPENQLLGWILMCVGVTLMFPTAVLINKCIRIAWRESSEKQGYIVQSYTATERTLNTSSAPSSIDNNVINDNAIAPTSFLSQACLPPSATAACCGITDFANSETASYVVPEMSGCYIVHYPNKTVGAGGGAHHHHHHHHHNKTNNINNNKTQILTERKSSSNAAADGENNHNNNSSNNDHADVSSSASSMSSISNDSSSHGTIFGTLWRSKFHVPSSPSIDTDKSG